MDELWFRLLVIAALTAAVAGTALATRKWQRPGHPRLDVSGRGLGPGAVVFTSTDCSTCKETLQLIRNLEMPLREVTWELEGRVLEELGVSAVPLTTFVGAGDVVVDQIVGVPRRRRLRRAEARWRHAMDG